MFYSLTSPALGGDRLSWSRDVFPFFYERVQKGDTQPAASVQVSFSSELIETTFLSASSQKAPPPSTNVGVHTGGLQPLLRPDLPLRLFVTANLLISKLDGRGVRSRIIFFSLFVLFSSFSLQRAPQPSRRSRLLPIPHHHSSNPSCRCCWGLWPK